MDYKKTLSKHKNWLIFFEKYETNIYKKNYYSWLIISNLHIIKKESSKISPFIKYSSMEKFYKTLTELIFYYKKNQIIKKNFDEKKIENLFPGERTKNLFFDLYLKMKKNDFQRLIKEKISAFINEEEFFYFLYNFNFFHNKWNLKDYIEILNKNNLTNNIVYNKNNILILQIFNFKEAFSLGTHNWCISRKESFFKEHNIGCSKLFFIYDFNKKQYLSSSNIGVTIGYADFLDIMHCYDLENKITTLKEYSSIIESIVLGKDITRKKILQNILNLNDNYSKIKALINNNFKEDSLKQFHELITDRDKDFKSLVLELIHRKRHNHFLIEYIKSDLPTKKEKNIITDCISYFLTDTFYSFDFYFLTEFFEAIDDNDYALNMTRKLAENYSSKRAFKFLLINVLKGKFDKEYIFHYCLKTNLTDTLKDILSDSCIDSFNLYYLFSLFSSQEFKRLEEIINLENKKNKNTISLKFQNRMKYIKLKIFHIFNDNT